MSRARTGHVRDTVGDTVVKRLGDSTATYLPYLVLAALETCRRRGDEHGVDLLTHRLEKHK